MPSDLQLRKQMQLELKRIQDEVGITFVFVTHDQEEAMTISDRIAVMNRGRIEQLGAPEAVYEHPASTFVAEFLGTSNLLPGTYKGVREGNGWVDVGNGHEIQISVDPRLREGQRLHVGVRPEKITVNPATTANDRAQNSMDATLTSSVFVGVSYQYFFRTRDGRQLSAFDRNIGRGAIASAGEAVCLTWRPEHTFVIPDKPGESETGDTAEQGVGQ